jgi:hypothetical protein
MRKHKFLFGLFLSLSALISTRGKSVQPGNDGEGALQCILPIEGEARKYLGLSKDAAVEVRLHQGGIPGTSQVESKEQLVTIVLYAKRRSRAMIRTAYIGTGGQVEIGSMPYFLKKTQGVWRVVDGEGGPGIFEAVAAFVTSLNERPMLRVRGDRKVHSWCQP